MFKFGNRRRNAPTITVEVPEVPLPAATHSSEVERERVANLVEVSRLLDDAPALGALAISLAHEISDNNNLDFDEIAAGVSFLHEVV